MDTTLPRRRFGTTDLHVSPIALGTVKFGRDQHVKYPNAFRIPDDNHVRELLALATDLGINVIDTAPAYGNSETRLGALLGRQQDWLICTKVGEEFDHNGSHFDFSPEHTRFSVERSLTRLQRDALDIVLIHSNGNDLDIIEHHGTLDALADLKQQGKIRAFGLSGKTVASGLAALQRSDCAMVTFNTDYDAELPVIDYAATHNKGIIIKKAFASGHIIERDIDDPIKASFTTIFNQAGVHSVTIGTINPQHLRQNVATAVDVLKVTKKSTPTTYLGVHPTS